MVEKDFRLLDADVSIADAVKVVTARSASHIVVCNRTSSTSMQPTGKPDLVSSTQGRWWSSRDDEDEEVSYHPEYDYFVFETGALMKRLTTDVVRPRLDLGVGDALAIGDLTPAPVRRLDATFHAPSDRPFLVVDGSRIAGVEMVARPPGVTGGGGDAGGGGDSGAGDDEGELLLAIAVDHPDEVAVEATFSVLVRLTVDLSQQGTIPIRAEVGDRIDFHLSAGEGLAIAGPVDLHLDVTGEVESLPVRFQLRALRPGPASATIVAFRAGLPLGSSTITVQVVPLVAGPEQRRQATADLRARSLPRADLELAIFVQRDEQGRLVLDYRLTSAEPALKLNMAPYRSAPLELEPGAYMAARYEALLAMPRGSTDLRRLAAREIGDLGASLFKALFPEELRTLLWRIRDRISTVLINSDEPWIPWEICKLYGEDESGRVIEGGYFCEAFELTRWKLGKEFVDVPAAREIAVIRPLSELPKAEDEERMVLALGHGARRATAVRATLDQVREALARGTYDVIHFVGHGDFPTPSDPDSAQLRLNGSQVLRPGNITGTVLNMRDGRPIVFLNACETGRSAPALTGLGGWAPAMLDAGASVFVGTHWDVTDDLALAFATTFYERLLAGSSVGQAARTARLAIKGDGGDPSWLAYAVFAGVDAGLAGATA